MTKFKLALFIAIVTLVNVGCTINRPEITEEAQLGSAQLIGTNSEIEDAEVYVEKDKITFYILPTEETEATKERLREIGADFLKFLGGYTASDEISGPTDESYGEIFDYYDAEIIIEGFRQIVDKGFKPKGVSEIQWEE